MYDPIFLLPEIRVHNVFCRAPLTQCYRILLLHSMPTKLQEITILNMFSLFFQNGIPQNFHIQMQCAPAANGQQLHLREHRQALSLAGKGDEFAI